MTPRRRKAVAAALVAGVLVVLVIGYRRDVAGLDRRVDELRARVAGIVLDQNTPSDGFRTLQELGADTVGLVSIASGPGASVDRITCVRLTVRPGRRRPSLWFWLSRTVSFEVDRAGTLTEVTSC